MDGIEQMIQMQNSISKQLNCSTISTLLSNDKSLKAIGSATKAFVDLQNDSALQSISKSMQQYQKLMEPFYKESIAMRQALIPALESYSQISKLTSAYCQMSDISKSISTFSKSMQTLMPSTNYLSQMSDLTSRILVEPRLLTNLHEAINRQIDISLWEDFDYRDRINDEDFAKEMEADILEIAEYEDNERLMQHFIAKWGEKGKQIIIQIFRFIIITFISGYMNYISEPVYKMITPVFLRDEESIETEPIAEIPSDTEIHVWGDVINQFIEITYTVNNVEYQGYITKEDLENNSQKISNEIEMEHLIFIQNTVETLAEHWNKESEIVYRFLKKDTNLLNDYILEHYDVLSCLEENSLIDAIETYCKNNEIDIPK